MTPVIAYHPYLLVALELDAGWSRKRESPIPEDGHAFKDIFDKLDQACRQHKSGIIQTALRNAQACELEDPTPLADYLLNPIFQLPAGHADCLAFILLDDFDSLHHITAHTRTIEDLTLAFCPTVASLGLEGYWFVQDPHLFWKQRKPATDGAGLSPGVTTLSKFKLDGICSLEYGLLFKRTILRAIAHRCNEALQELPMSREAEQLVSAGDVAATRISLLCSQGQEELSLLIATPNPIINVSLLAAVRSLVLADILSVDSNPDNEHLRSLLSRKESEVSPGRNKYRHGSLHRKLLAAQGSADAPDNNISVFRWSRSQMAFSIAVSGNKLGAAPGLAGFVGLDFDFQFTPGVDPSSQEQSRIELEEELPFRDGLPEGWYLGELGTSDYRFSPRTTRRLIGTAAAVNHICHCINTAVELNHKERHSGLLGINTTFLVPIPSRAPFVRSRPVRESPLDQALPAAYARLRSQPDGTELLDMEKLLERPKQYGLPRALRRSIEALFNNYILAIYNPNLFDLVADLHDAFTTFNRILTKELPQLFDSPGGRKVIDADRIQALARYATALKNAFERRLDLAYPDSTIRNMSVQFPGSFAQILFAADAPLKASLGVLKYHTGARPLIDGSKEPGNGDTATLASVGVVTELTLEPGIRTFDLVLGLDKDEEERIPRLSFLHMDLDHLFHPGSFLDCVHEAFHLVFDELFWKDPQEIAVEAGKRLAYDDWFTRERIEETWVQIACMLFFAPDKPVQLLKYLIGKYALGTRSGGPERATVIRNFAEHVCRLVVAASAVEGLSGSDDSTDASAPTLEECEELLQQNLEVLLRLFPETARMSAEEFALTFETIQKHLQIFWQEARLDYYLPAIWKVALTQFYGRLCRDLSDFDADNRQPYSENLRQLEEGWAITRHGEGSSYVDSVTGTAILLGGYLTRFDETLEKGVRFHLDRDQTGEISFERNCTYADYLIDRGAAQRFVFKADARARRLRHQIGLIETFWDFSSHFRARRIYALLSSNRDTVF